MVLGRKIRPVRGKMGLWCRVYRVKTLKSVFVASAAQGTISFLFPFVLAFVRGFPSTTALFRMVCPLEWRSHYNELY